MQRTKSILVVSLSVALAGLACAQFGGGGVQPQPAPAPVVPPVGQPADTSQQAAPTNTSQPPTSAPVVQAGDAYADRVVTFSPGTGANPTLADTNTVLGAPDFNASSLSGFVNLGVGGSITVEFVDNQAADGSGPDIRVHGDPDDDDLWTVEVSADGVDYRSFGMLSEVVSLDLSTVGLTAARFVRLTDDRSAPSNPNAITPGAELDSVEALNSQAPGAG